MPKETMKQLIMDFPQQLRRGIESVKQLNLDSHTNIKNAHVAGVGGSGIGASYTKEIIKEYCTVPYDISKSYSIPAYVGKDTLFIASSYSGNTEETITAVKAAIDKEAHIICITTGGELETLCKEHGLELVLLPKGENVPRAFMGTSLIHQIGILQHYNLIPELLGKMEKAINLIEKESDAIKSKAEEIAQAVAGRFPVLYATERMESVVVRLRQQLNENSKQLSWHSVIPEMNHNELVGWSKEYDDVVVLSFRNEDDYHRNAVRADISRDIIKKYAHKVIEVYSKGDSLLEKMIYLTNLGDWISYYLAEILDVDPLPVEVINFLKGELSQVK